MRSILKGELVSIFKIHAHEGIAPYLLLKIFFQVSFRLNGSVRMHAQGGFELLNEKRLVIVKICFGAFEVPKSSQVDQLI